MTNGRIRKKNEKFDKFRSQFLNLTDIAKTNEQLAKFGEKYSTYIAGSDQIWNKKNTNGVFDKAYFLDFVQKGKRKIAYAASVGVIPNEEYAIELAGLVENLDWISVREKSLKKILQKYTGREIFEVCDPTLFLTKEEWIKKMNLEERKVKSYVLVYSFMPTDEMRFLIKNLRKEYGLEVVDISHQSCKIENSVIDDRSCGPIDFLDYVYNAEIIITDSFHGTVFSVIFNKKFISFIRKDTGSRIEDLLGQIGLENRIYAKLKIEEAMENIDYSHIDIYRYTKASTDMLLDFFHKR